MSSQAPVRCFIADIQAHAVRIEQDGDRTMVCGLPLFRPGTWNGVTYTDDDVQAMIDALPIVRDVMRFEPGLKPFHTVDADGSFIAMDARQMHGWWQALYWDDARETVLGDVWIVDEGVVEDIRSGKLRYLSAEIAFGYPIEDGRVLPRVLLGAAWVDIPAVSGMEWQITANRLEYTQGRFAVHGMGELSMSELSEAISQRIRELDDYADAEWVWVTEVYDSTVIVDPEDGNHYRHGYAVSGRTVTVETARTQVEQTWQDVQPSGSEPQEQKVRSMGVWAKLKGILAGLGVAAEALEELDAEDAMAPEEGETAGNAAAPAAAANRAGDSEAARQLAMLQRQITEQGETIAALREQRILDQSEAIVEDLVRQGHLPPAERAKAFGLISSLTRSESKVRVFRAGADGQPQEQEEDAVAVLAEVLGSRTPISTEPRGLTFLRAEQPAQHSQEERDAVVERLSKLVGATE